MPHPFELALRCCWLVFIGYWLWSARKVKPAVQSESRVKRLFVYWLPLFIAVLLLGPGEWFGHGWLREQFVPHSVTVESIGLAMCITGVALACWARYLLGDNWSSTVQLKQGHELIERGPYAVIRHPIYTGLLLLFIGNAVMVGDRRGLLAIVIVFVSFWRKLRLEETWLAQLFGESYAAYRTRTKALVPWVL